MTEIQMAYEILSDPEKKIQYDNSLNMNNETQSSTKTQQGHPHEFDINNIFKMFYENGPQFANHIFQNLNKPIPIVINLDITLQQSYNGTYIPVEITRWIIVANNIDNKINETETIYIPVPKGVDTGEILILKERGNVISEMNKGDIKVIFKIINNTPFFRNGLDLYYKKTITLKESLCGFIFEIMHINEKTNLRYNTTSENDDLDEFNIISNGFKHVIPKLGMIRDDSTIGNLIIEFTVIFPEKITREQREQIANIL
jgi:DnaJ-class molecular chaperone